MAAAPIARIAVVLLFALAAACEPTDKDKKDEPPPPPPPEPTSLTVRALPVTETAQRQLAAGFYIGPPVAGEPSILSHGTGGACLLAQTNPLMPRQCTANEQCSITVRGQGTSLQGAAVPRDEWTGYCIKPTGQETGSCWVRPGPREQLCRFRTPADAKGDIALPETGAIDAGPLYAYLGASRASLTQGVKWAVLACLNPADPANPGKDTAICGGTGSGAPPIKPLGPATTVR